MSSSLAARRACTPYVRSGKRCVLAAPQHPDRTVAGTDDGLVAPPLLDGSLERPHDPQEGSAVVRPEKQAQVGVDGLGGHVWTETDRPHQRAEHHRHPCGREPHPPEDLMGERLHHPRPVKGVDGNDRVQQQDRADPVRRRSRDLEPDRPADVMHDEMNPVQPQRVKRSARPLPSPVHE